MVVPRFPPFFLFLLVHSLHNEAQLFNNPKKEKKNTLSSKRRKNFLMYLEGTLYIYVNIAYRTYRYYYSPLSG